MDAGSNGIVVLFIAALLYLLPTLFAAARGNSNTLAIFALNLLLGWTVLGWVLALVWSLTAVAKPPRPDRRKMRPCPQCAETILADARKCKHCGSVV